MVLYLFFGAILSFLPAIILGVLIGVRGKGSISERFRRSLPYTLGVWFVLSFVGAIMVDLWMQREAEAYFQYLRDREMSRQETETQVGTDDAKTIAADEE